MIIYMGKYFLAVAVMIVTVLSLKAQGNDGHHHEHLQNEIGISFGAVYEISHKEWAPGIHAHYFRAFTPHSPWAWGAGIEFIPGEEKHVEIGAGVRYQPIEKLQFSFVPGISVAGKARFSLHAEAVYEMFHLGSFHLGPVIGYAWTKDHSHISVGLHVAMAFQANQTKK